MPLLDSVCLRKRVLYLDSLIKSIKLQRKVEMTLEGKLT
jgi:hypothetical protein